MSVNITYTASSGNVYNLQAEKILRIKTANFHEHEWKAAVTEQQYGATVNQFTKDPITYEAELMFMGSYEKNKELIEELHDDFENDVISMKPGTLTWGDYSIETFVTYSSTEPADPWTKNVVRFYCPYPFWVREKTISIYAYSPSVLSTDKQYDEANGLYAYGYTYVGAQNRAVFVREDNRIPCDFKIVAYGPFTYMAVTLNGTIHRIDYTVESGDYMVVDSRRYGRFKGQAYVISNGVKTDVFDYRDPCNELFAKVSGGNITIDYARTYGIDVTFFFERSEPKWTLS